jgi:hypothetical protein
MPADDPFAFLAAEQPKPAPAKKPHWRDKLFSKDKNRSTPDKQIEDFLATSRPVPDGLAPKADIPKDYPSAPLSPSQFTIVNMPLLLQSLPSPKRTIPPSISTRGPLLISRMPLLNHAPYPPNQLGNPP